MTKNFTASIVEIVYTGRIFYKIVYNFFIAFTIFGKKFQIKSHKKRDSYFYFYTVDEAEKYIHSIEWPEKKNKKYASVYYIYPKGSQILKKYGCFEISGYEISTLNGFALNTRFSFDNWHKYGGDYAVPEDFFKNTDNIHKVINNIIDERHLKATDKICKCISVKYEELPIKQIYDVSNDIKELKNIVDAFYEYQDTNNKMIKNLLDKK